MTFTHFYSDPHFGHANILKHCPNRPYTNISEMEEDFVKRFNAKVQPEDHVLFCGDVFFPKKKTDPSEFGRVLERLNGRKSLVIGNHDPSPAVMRQFFEMVTNQLELVIEGVDCLVCHYPYAYSESYLSQTGIKDKYFHLRPMWVEGRILIHGHTHSLNKRNGDSIHVGVDAWDLGPASLQEVSELVKEIQRGWS